MTTHTATLTRTGHTASQTRCTHRPACPPADRPDHDAARVISSHPEQGWSLLCNGVVVFDDTGELLPDGSAIPAHRPTTRYQTPALLAAAA
jgi:hypothetical protein